MTAAAPKNCLQASTAMASSPSSSLGYLAAFTSCVAFGSFAVPIKGRAANSVNIDPLGELYELKE